MVTPQRIRTITSAALVALWMCGSAQAQPRTRLYAGGSVGAFRISSDQVDGHSAAAGFFGGYALSRYVDFELELVLPATTLTQSTSGTSVSFASPGASRDEIERLAVTTRFDRYRDVSSNASAVVVIHPPIDARVTPGVVLGITNQRVRDRTTFTPLKIPPGIDPQHPAVIAREESASRSIGGPTIGGNLLIRLSPRVFIVPDVRYDYGSIGDEINNALRTSVRVMWRF